MKQLSRNLYGLILLSGLINLGKKLKKEGKEYLI